MAFFVLFLSSEKLSAQLRYEDRKNLVKTNFSSLVLRNIQIHSEHLLTERVSLGIGVRYMPTGPIPFATRLASLDKDISLEELDKISLDNYAVSPEIRWYFGNRGLGSGFYLAAFFQIARYRVQYGGFEISFVRADDGEKFNRDMDIDGRLNSLTGGFYLGKQWKLAHRIYVDWWILGGSYGRANGALTAKVQLSNGEQEAIATDIGGVVEEFPIIRFAPRIYGQGIFVDIESFWAGIRTGLCLGLLF